MAFLVQYTLLLRGQALTVQRIMLFVVLLYIILAFLHAGMDQKHHTRADKQEH